MTTPTNEVTQLLLAWGQGDRAALDRLMPLVYAELRRLAGHYLAGERQGHTLQATALVNEAYLQLVDSGAREWQNRAHFFGVAAQLMRRILVDHARARNSLKRGGGAQQITFDEGALVSHERFAEIVALDDALRALAAFDERKSRIVELRFFGGLSIEETAAALGVSPGTVMRDWTLAKAWLQREMSKEQTDGE
jgi:RNA polymerase sigma factor (TIGR02999 family)